MSSLLVSEVFPPVHGGSGRWFWEIYRRLPRAQYAIAAGEDPRQAEFDRTHNLRIARLPLKQASWGLRNWRGLMGYLATFRALRQLMMSEDVRALHCGRCLPEGFAAWMLRCWTGVPYIVYVHGEDATTAATSRELSWMVRRVCGVDAAMPPLSASVAWACGSRSMTSTRCCMTARAPARFTAVVVLPHPPFWFMTAMTCRIRFFRKACCATSPSAAR